MILDGKNRKIYLAYVRYISPTINCLACMADRYVLRFDYNHKDTMK